MILVSSAVGSWELKALIEKQGVHCESSFLESGDACFEGQGPHGLTGVGIERKRLRDMLDCINDGRYNEQRVLMSKRYSFSFLIVEGYWKPDIRSGILLRGLPQPNGTVVWTDQWGQGMSRQMYYKLRRYLFSVALSGVFVLYTRDVAHTAYDICECFHYFQKPWQDHKSMLSLHQRTLTIPTLNRRASLTRRWAFELGGVGMQYSEDAERIFRTPRLLANSEEQDWMKVPGIGPKTAIEIVKEIGGYKR